MADKTRFERWVSEIMALRAQFSDAGVDMYARVIDWENDRESWFSSGGNGFGFLTFEEALHSSQIMKPHRLEHFKEIVRRVGSIEKVREIGIEAGEVVVCIPEGAKSRQTPGVDASVAVVNDMIEFRKRNGREPSGLTAKSARLVHAPPIKRVREAPVFADEVARLKHENAELVRQVNAGQRRILALESKLSAAEGALAKARERLSDARKAGGARKAGKH